MKVSRELISKFWSKVDQSGGPDACWPWIKCYKGVRSHSKILGKGMTSSRVAWILHHKRFPKNFVLHCCPTGSNENCCNPAHLYDGTRRQNMDDAMREGRMRGAPGALHGLVKHPECRATGERNGAHTHPEKRPIGESHGMALLTSEDVKEIRHLYNFRWRTHVTWESLAKQFGVSAVQIGSVLSRRAWKHI